MHRRDTLVAAALVTVFTLVSGEAADQLPSLEELLRYEKQLVERETSHPQRTKLNAFGSDPFKIRFLRDRQQYLILLRNGSEVWLTDDSLNLIGRHSTPPSPTGWTLVNDRFLLISGELSSYVGVLEITPKGFVPVKNLQLPGVASIRDLIYVPSSQSLFMLDGFDRRLIQATLPAEWWHSKAKPAEIKSYPLGAGPMQIRHEASHLLINLLLEHSLVIVPLFQGQPDFSQSSRIMHNGPIWGFDAMTRNDSLLIAATGVENRPLNRLGGEFGYIDSFLYLFKVQRRGGIYRWSPMDREQPNYFHQINLSEIEVITPKAVRFVRESEVSTSLWVAAFGSARIAGFNLDGGRVHLDRTYNLLPGITDFAMASAKTRPDSGEGRVTSMVMTNALIDGIYRVEMSGGKSTFTRVNNLRVEPGNLTWQSRVGELLFFTDLLTPYNRSDGELSRFTCEGCHFEGAIDGRVHYTGRGHVFATTKTLRGLGNNVPLFSRAGDKSLAAMVLAEFRVANQNRRDSFFIEPKNYPWLSQVEGLPKTLTPRDLRLAFLSFFVDYRHRPNPWRLHSNKLSAKARQGLATFRSRCAHCHQAIVSTREPEPLPFKEWAGWLETDAKDLIWGAPFYTKTGIKPYVHRAGARVPSLRRIQQKYPYFTNGSSPTLRHLLERFRYLDLTAWHHYEASMEEKNGKKVKALTADEINQLEELLRFY